MRERYTVLFSLLVGLAIGVGAFTFLYAKGYSYLTNDPAACANCHVMGDYYAAWLKGSHHSVATCNDCHTPHDNIVSKYMVKASNGFWHSFGFTTGRYPDPLRIKPGNRSVTEHTCRYCHSEIVVAMEPGMHQTGTGTTSQSHREDETLSCIRCHSTVGHWVR